MKDQQMSDLLMQLKANDDYISKLEDQLLTFNENLENMLEALGQVLNIEEMSQQSARIQRATRVVEGIDTKLAALKEERKSHETLQSDMLISLQQKVWLVSEQRTAVHQYDLLTNKVEKDLFITQPEDEGALIKTLFMFNQIPCVLLGNGRIYTLHRQALGPVDVTEIRVVEHGIVIKDNDGKLSFFDGTNRSRRIAKKVTNFEVVQGQYVIYQVLDSLDDQSTYKICDLKDNTVDSLEGEQIF